MYRVLIVDDERLARESVRDLLETQDDLELEIWMAESAMRALEILESERIDLAILDINMPKVSGLELYSTVRKNWRQCRVVFLTGYSEFDYVYQVHRHARYVLKGESDEVLLEAVRESLNDVERGLLVNRVSETETDYRKRALWHRGNDLISEMLEGYTPPEAATEEIFREVGIPLDPQAPVYAILSRVEGLAETEYARRQEMYGQIQLLLEKWFTGNFRCFIVIWQRTSFLLLLQPEAETEEQAAVKRLSELSSLYQTSIQANTGLNAAIFIPDAPFDSLPDLVRAFPQIQAGLGTVDAGDAQVRSLSAAPGASVSREDLNQRLKQYVGAHLAEDVSVTALADHFHFSREYIMRIFKKEEGVTILQYINDLRIRKAQELLTRGETQVQDIAAQTGFGGSGQFIRFFKSRTGMTPQAYRENRQRT